MGRWVGFFTALRMTGVAMVVHWSPPKGSDVGGGWFDRLSTSGFGGCFSGDGGNTGMTGGTDATR